VTADQFPTSDGLPSIPWLWLAPVAVLAGIWLYRTRGHWRAALAGPTSLRLRIGTIAVILYVQLFVVFGLGRAEPIDAGAVAAPGPGVESRRGGVIHVVDNHIVYRGAPFYRVAAEPGDEFQVLTSIKNVGPIPITLLGPLRTDIDTAADPEVAYVLSAIFLAPSATNSVYPASADLITFSPVALGPGEEVSLVLAFTGGACADPNGQFKPPWNPSQLSFTTGPGFPFVYELALWRKVGTLWPQFDLDVGRCSAPE
jgi:hypothetical protein